MSSAYKPIPKPAAREETIGEILVAHGELRPEDLEHAEAVAEEQGQTIEDVLKEEGKVTEELIARAVAEHFKIPAEDQMAFHLAKASATKRILSLVLRDLLGKERWNRSVLKFQRLAESRRRSSLRARALREAESTEAEHVHRAHAATAATIEEGIAARLREERARKRAERKQRWQAWWTGVQEKRMARREERRKRAEERAHVRAEKLAEQTRIVEEKRAEKARIAEEKRRVREEEKAKQEAERAAAEAEKKRVQEERAAEQVRIAEEKNRVKEEERMKKEAMQAERRAARAERFCRFRETIGGIFRHASKENKAADAAKRDEERLAGEARREAVREMLIEQEKKKLREKFGGESPQASALPVVVQISGQPGIVSSAPTGAVTPAAVSAGGEAPTGGGASAEAVAAAQKQLERERAALAEERSRMQAEAAAAAERQLATERAALAGEKERIRAEALAEAEAHATGTKNVASAEATHHAERAAELEKTLAQEQAKWALEKERIRAEALAEAEARLAAEQAASGRGKRMEAKGSTALSQELEKWKQQVEKLEGERKQLEQQRALQEEQDRAQKEQRRLEEERLALERQRLERERENLEEEKAFKQRVAEEKHDLAQVKEHLEEKKKEIKAEEKSGAPAPAQKEAVSAKAAKGGTGWLGLGKGDKKTKEKSSEEAAKAWAQAELDIGKILLAQNYIDEGELSAAKEKAKERNVPLEHVLKDDGLVTKEILQNAIAEFYKVPFVDLRAQPPDSAVIELLPESFSIAYSAVAVQRSEEGALLVATSGPERENLLQEIKQLVPTATSVSLAYAPRESIESALTFYRKPLDTRFRKILEEHKKVAPEIIEEIFNDAIQLGASDIHFEPQEKIIIVRFRVDGVMHEAGRIPREYYEGIVNRIKIAGNMRIDEHFTAQDGAIRWKSGNRAMDVRVSIVPIVDGEKIVMRLLSEYVRTLTLSDLGFTMAQREVLIKAAHKPFGMVLTTGPTGSGKSTTLYGLMKIRNTPDVNISTIEDPVEYKIPGINHIQVNAKTDLTFERGLRALVRQDPDIILVGEIRDNITAQISVNAALTGHLLFSTLHANDAATAVPRLLEMGIEPYLLASTLEIIIAQRLMRRICMSCRYSFTVSYQEACQLFLHAERYFDPKEPRVTLYRGKGCAACGDTGYKGRVGVYELLIMTQEIEDLIVRRGTTADINEAARRQGMLTLFEDGLLKVKSGFSTVEELLRVAAPPDILDPTPHTHAHSVSPEKSGK